MGRDFISPHLEDRQLNIIRITVAAAFATFAATNAFASDGQTTQATQAEPAISDTTFALSLQEDIGVWSFDESIAAFDTEISWKAAEWLKVSASLPVYNTGGSTGLGDIGVDASVRVIDGKCDFLFADKASFYLNGGLGIPVDGEFSSDNLVYRVGADASLSWGKWTLDGGVSYSFVDGNTFVPQLGGFVGGDWGSADGTLSYAWGDMNAGARTTYTWSADDGNILTLGPVVGWKPWDAVSIGAEVGFTLDESDLQSGGSDFFVAASIGFEF